MFHAKLVYAKGAVCQSPVIDDFDRVVNLDEKGNEHITFEKVDYSKVQDSLGDFMQWSLKSLTAAGIDPNFGIRTGFNTRLDGVAALQAGIDAVVNVVESENKSE